MKKYHSAVGSDVINEFLKETAAQSRANRASQSIFKIQIPSPKKEKRVLSEKRQFNLITKT